jgi:hypothetical protein
MDFRERCGGVPVAEVLVMTFSSVDSGNSASTKNGKKEAENLLHALSLHHPVFHFHHSLVL